MKGKTCLTLQRKSRPGRHKLLAYQNKNKKPEPVTHLLLSLAFGLLFSWVWDGDVQWSLQSCQVITVEGCLTENI